LDNRLDLTFGKDSPDISPDESNVFAVVRLDEEHFITRYLNISGSISGYNDVTQKVGANRLVTTSMGKPVVTSWQFGLGRVVSLSTDNGKFWSSELYSGENARLMPSIINWVVGDWYYQPQNETQKKVKLPPFFNKQARDFIFQLYLQGFVSN